MNHDTHISYKYIQYSEGNNSLILDVDPPGLPGADTIVYIPTLERWKMDMPDWAKGRREEILNQIQKDTSHLPWKWEKY